MKSFIIFAIFFTFTLAIRSLVVHELPVDEKTVCNNVTNVLHKKLTLPLEYIPAQLKGNIAASGQKVVCSNEKCEQGIAACVFGRFDCLCNKK
jgi:hypothetical protein